MSAGYRPDGGGTSLDAYDFELPDAQIATRPSARRSASRLLVLGRRGNEHATFAELGRFLRPGDLLVANDARVSSWRLDAVREATGAHVELLLLSLPAGGGPAEALCRPAKRVHPGEALLLAPGLRAEVLSREGGRCRLLLPADAAARIDRAGRLPLPPYIVQQRRARGEPEDSAADRERYQTVYAAASGAVAAPTAGLHFTPELIAGLGALGIGWAKLSLLVGPGTFEPVRAARIAEHRVEPERYAIPEATWTAVEATRRAGASVVAVGTTSCRALESAALTQPPRLAGEASLTILPGHRFRTVDALVTNFHLPRSSLLLLVSALAGRERILGAYREAAAAGYRFYSYGDAMLIDPRSMD
jgi:S-adenosylmethionine:tRNA ribosyltransferase-isomerase